MSDCAHRRCFPRIAGHHVRSFASRRTNSLPAQHGNHAVSPRPRGIRLAYPRFFLQARSLRRHPVNVRNVYNVHRSLPSSVLISASQEEDKRRRTIAPSSRPGTRRFVILKPDTLGGRQTHHHNAWWRPERVQILRARFSPCFTRLSRCIDVGFAMPQTADTQVNEQEFPEIANRGMGHASSKRDRPKHVKDPHSETCGKPLL
jgi:hypothetical protein